MVFTDTLSSDEIAFVPLPSPISCNTSRYREVNSVTDPLIIGVASPFKPCSMADLAMDGER